MVSSVIVVMSRPCSALTTLLFQISHDDYKPVVNQIFPREDPYLTTDSVFAVKDDLVVDFKPLEGHKEATLDLQYNIILVPAPKDKTPVSHL